MAKKRGSKAARPGRKSSVARKKTPAKRPTRRAARPAAPKRDTLAPVPVSTGRGATPAEIGADLVAKFNTGQLAEIENQWWAPQIESVEGVGVAQGWRGVKAVHAKNAWWAQDHVMHGGSAEGPYVGAAGFAVKFRLDIETKSTGQREMMEEVGVYTVRDGKIVREEFMYSCAGAPPTA